MFLTVEKRPLDSPFLRGQLGQGQGIYDGRSPGITALKEAFDVTYAVHRMEEEGRTRGRRGVGARGYLAGLNEDEEYEDDQEEMAPEILNQEQLVQQPRSLMDETTGPRDQGKVVLTSGMPAHAPPGPAIDASVAKERERHKRGGRTAFELHMDNATLLGRRQNAHRDPAMDGIR